MPFKIDPQPQEEIYLLREFRGSHRHVFAIGVSNQALYLPVEKRLTLKKDPWYFKRVALNEVNEVRVKKQKFVPLLVLSSIMFLFGSAVSFLMIWHNLHPMPGERLTGSGWPIAIAVGGIVIPFIGRGRRTLTVSTRAGAFKWKPQLAIDRKTRNECSAIQDEILEACRKANIQTFDSDNA
jgi:hypothetical protein